MENKERQEYSEALAVVIEKIREAIEKGAALRYVLDIEAAKARKDAKTEEKGEERAEAISWEIENKEASREMTEQIQKLEDLAEYLQDMEREGINYAEAEEIQRQDQRQDWRKEKTRREAQALGLFPEDREKLGNE